jgi:hypothetical protein
VYRQYDLYKLFSFPREVANGTFIHYNIESAYLAFQVLHHTYVLFSVEELSKCPGRQPKTCAVTIPIYGPDIKSCVLSLYLVSNNTRSLRPHCVLLLQPRQCSVMDRLFVQLCWSETGPRAMLPTREMDHHITEPEWFRSAQERLGLPLPNGGPTAISSAKRHITFRRSIPEIVHPRAADSSIPIGGTVATGDCECFATSSRHQHVTNAPASHRAGQLLAHVHTTTITSSCRVLAHANDLGVDNTHRITTILPVDISLFTNDNEDLATFPHSSRHTSNTRSSNFHSAIHIRCQDYGSGADASLHTALKISTYRVLTVRVSHRSVTVLCCMNVSLARCRDRRVCAGRLRRLSAGYSVTYSQTGESAETPEAETRLCGLVTQYRLPCQHNRARVSA